MQIELHQEIRLQLKNQLSTLLPQRNRWKCHNEGWINGGETGECDSVQIWLWCCTYWFHDSADITSDPFIPHTAATQPNLIDNTTHENDEREIEKNKCHSHKLIWNTNHTGVVSGLCQHAVSLVRNILCAGTKHYHRDKSTDGKQEIKRYEMRLTFVPATRRSLQKDTRKYSSGHVCLTKYLE